MKVKKDLALKNADYTDIINFIEHNNFAYL